MIGGVLDLAEHGGKNLAPGGGNRRIGRRTIILDQLMQTRQRMVGHQWEHVMFDVIVHVPVDEPADRVHMDRAAVEPVIENVFRETGVLGGVVDNHQPGAEKVRQDDQEYRHPRLQGYGSRDDGQIDRKDDAGVAVDFRETRFPG